MRKAHMGLNFGHLLEVDATFPTLPVNALNGSW